MDYISFRTHSQSLLPFFCSCIRLRTPWSQLHSMAGRSGQSPSTMTLGDLERQDVRGPIFPLDLHMYSLTIWWRVNRIWHANPCGEGWVWWCQPRSLPSYKEWAPMLLNSFKTPTYAHKVWRRATKFCIYRRRMFYVQHAPVTYPAGAPSPQILGPQHCPCSEAELCKATKLC